MTRRWVQGGDPSSVHDAAARAYARYQKCRLSAARRLFYTPTIDEAGGGAGQSR